MNASRRLPKSCHLPIRLGKNHLVAAIAFIFGYKPAIAQETATTPAVSTNFTQQQVTDLWFRSFASATDVINGFPPPLPFCLTARAILQERTLRPLAILHIQNILIGPITNGSPNEADDIFVFKVEFPDKRNNPLFKSWSKQLYTNSISQVAIEFTIDIQPGSTLLQNAIGNGYEFYVYSGEETKVVPNPTFDYITLSQESSQLDNSYRQTHNDKLCK